MKANWRHVEWTPVSTGGRYWLAHCDGALRGSVVVMDNGRHQVAIHGRRTYYGRSMRDCAKQLVAWLNNMKPSSL